MEKKCKIWWEIGMLKEMKRYKKFPSERYYVDDPQRKIVVGTYGNSIRGSQALTRADLWVAHIFFPCRTRLELDRVSWFGSDFSTKWVDFWIMNQETISFLSDFWYCLENHQWIRLFWISFFACTKIFEHQISKLFHAKILFFIRFLFFPLMIINI